MPSSQKAIVTLSMIYFNADGIFVSGKNKYSHVDNKVRES